MLGGSEKKMYIYAYQSCNCSELAGTRILTCLILTDRVFVPEAAKKLVGESVHVFIVDESYCLSLDTFNLFNDGSRMREPYRACIF